MIKFQSTPNQIPKMYHIYKFSAINHKMPLRNVCFLALSMGAIPLTLEGIRF